ncbi:MAG: MobQ family relaxase [Clostridium sp.]|nr:MobQ family relaxase [Clostridium sp.]
MSIYHFGQMKVISRGTGRSAIASSAYISGEKLYNEYDGLTHDYTKKQGVVFSEVMLSENAKDEWKNRQILWNEVEKIEKSKVSQLARSFEVGLQTEFTLEENIKLIKEYVKDNFIDKGMCADICIHDKSDGNPHAHVMLTMRKIDEQGKFLPKAEKQYLCRNDKGDEKYLRSNDLKEDRNFEKVYKCKCKNDYKELTNRELEMEEYKNYKKISKYPLDKKIDMCADWNNNNNVELWREEWARINNKLFKEKRLNIRIDHRSYERQEINRVPTIHEGYGARLRAKNGKECDRIEINRYITNINEKIKGYENDIHKLKNEMIELNRDMDVKMKSGREEISLEHPKSSYKTTDSGIKEILKELKEKMSDKANKHLRIDRALIYVDKRKIKTDNDVKVIRSQLSTIRTDYGNRIDAIDDYINRMNSIYDNILRKSREVNSLEKEVEELGIFKFKQKKYLNERIEELKNEINEFKESELYQKNLKYTDKLDELKRERKECLEVLKKCDNENSILYDIETLSKDKNKLIGNLNNDKKNDINFKVKRYSNELEL